jgi:hypothetical protein
MPTSALHEANRFRSVEGWNGLKDNTCAEHMHRDQETIMSQRAHERAAELHNLAAHAHSVAAVAHGKEDHLTAHELSKQAHEHSMNVHKLTQELGQKTGPIQGAEAPTQKP